MKTFQKPVSYLFAMLVTVAPAWGQTDSSATEADSSSGKFSVDGRVFYFNRDFDLPDKQDAEAFTAGGIAKYETPSWQGLSGAIAGYGSFNLFGIVDRSLSVGTDMLAPDTSDIAFIGEAYIDFDRNKNQLKGGRQRLATPLMNDRDWRMLPSVYEALIYRNTTFQDTLLEAGYVYSETGFGSSFAEFDRRIDDWGQNGLAYVFLNTRLKQAGIRAQFVDTVENSGRYDQFGYADLSLPLRLGERSFLGFQAGTTAYSSEPTSTMMGFKAGTYFGAFRMVGLYNNISGNEYSAVEAGPMYSDWQQGYASYEPSEALGFQFGYKFNERLDLSTGAVRVKSKDGDNFNTDDYTESVFDVIYSLRKDTELHLRYSNKNQEQTSGREDRRDFRAIIYYNFPG